MILSLWYDKICDYAARRITFNSDRFPAIAGLAKEAAHTGNQYKADLWAEDVHSGLLWNASGLGVDTRHAPTWSWAVVDNQRNNLAKHGQNGGVANRCVLEDGYRAKVVDIQVKNINNDPFGQVESAHVIIEDRWPSVE